MGIKRGLGVAGQGRQLYCLFILTNFRIFSTCEPRVLLFPNGCLNVLLVLVRRFRTVPLCTGNCIGV